MRRLHLYWIHAMQFYERGMSMNEAKGRPLELNKVVGLVLLCVMVLMAMSSITASAAETENTPYETYLQTIYSREEGLAVGKANDIAATSDGIIWIGTYAGLYRYNGSKFQLMNQYDTAKSIECLYVDSRDRLWVGTNDNGISVFQDEELIGEITSEDGLPSDVIRSIIQGADGHYYVGTTDAMAVVSFEEDKPKVVKTLDAIQYADRSASDAAGHVAVISSYGKMFLVDQDEVVSEEVLPEGDAFSSCVFDRDGRLAVGTASGRVYQYEINGQSFVEKGTLACEGIRKVNNLIWVNDSTMMVCGDNGIGYFDANQAFHQLETPNFSSSIYHAIQDYQGNLWFSSSRLGLLRLCKTGFVDLFTEYSVKPSVVNSIERYQNLLYAGTDDGLVILDEAGHRQVENELTEYFANVRIRQILADRSGRLWFCTYGAGLVSYDGTTINRMDPEGTHVGTRVRTMLELSDGRLFAASEKGITCLRDGVIEQTLTQADGLKELINLCMLEKPDGTILIGSDGDGIAVMKHDSISTLGVKDGLTSGVILRMVNDPKGKGVFIVTSNSLCYMEEDGHIRQLDHFPYSNNYDLFVQDDMVFVLGSSGIYAVRRDELLGNEEEMHYTYLDHRAGLHNALVANAWALHEEEEQRIYLPTSTGVTAFDLEAYDERPTNFQIRIESISIDGESSSIVSSENFVFSKKVRRLEIQPEIINYSTVDPIISCYLEGFDRDPIVMPQSELSTIVYTNLPAGKYTFKMDLVDSESGVIISGKVYYLEKETAFADTIWFYALLVSAVILMATWMGIFVARRVYRRNMAEKERELARTWKLSMMDSLTGLKNRFAMRAAFPQYVGTQLTVTMMDIDYFKQFNDNYGHDMGDQILSEVSRVIRRHYSGDGEEAFRFGGDEFLLWDTNRSDEEVSEKLLTLEAEIRGINIDGCEEMIHISYGSESGIPKTEEDLRNMRNVADQKLYEVKRKRRGRK